jgi:hypothetical protein
VAFAKYFNKSGGSFITGSAMRGTKGSCPFRLKIVKPSGLRRKSINLTASSFCGALLRIVRL